MTSQYIIYARFSPRPDADDSSSNERQIQLCRDYVANKGGDVVGVYEDQGISGDKVDRPGLLDALASLRRGSTLLAYTHDRLARSAYLSISIEKAVEKSGAKIATVTGGLYDESPEGCLIRRILFDIAEYQKTLIAARTKRAMLRHQRDGRRMSFHAPYGTEADGDALVTSECEGTCVARVIELRKKGLGYLRISNMLADEGHVPRGRKWHPQTVKRIILRAHS